MDNDMFSYYAAEGKTYFIASKNLSHPFHCRKNCAYLKYLFTVKKTIVSLNTKKKKT